MGMVFFFFAWVEAWYMTGRCWEVWIYTGGGEDCTVPWLQSRIRMWMRRRGMHADMRVAGGWEELAVKCSGYVAPDAVLETDTDMASHT